MMIDYTASPEQIEAARQIVARLDTAGLTHHTFMADDAIQDRVYEVEDALKALPGVESVQSASPDLGAEGWEFEVTFRADDEGHVAVHEFRA